MPVSVEDGMVRSAVADPSSTTITGEYGVVPRSDARHPCATKHTTRSPIWAILAYAAFGWQSLARMTKEFLQLA
jgi:hypothetical protein